MSTTAEAIAALTAASRDGHRDRPTHRELLVVGVFVDHLDAALRRLNHLEEQNTEKDQRIAHLEALLNHQNTSPTA